MHFTKKIDRAFQWAGEKMGAEARTAHSEEFQMLENEMALRHEGMDRMQKSMGAYIKWISRRNEPSDDKERSSPTAYLGRTMATHGEDFEQDSEFGNCLLSLGRANERIAGIQDSYIDCASATWLDTLERSLTMMREYQNTRKKLENRRLAYDASTNKLTKARRDDFRVEEEVRMNKAKFEETSEDVLRRMQDIKESEVENISALTQFMDAELEYHERCAEELRRVKQSWAGGVAASPPTSAIRTTRSRSNTARSWQEPRHQAVYEEPEPEPLPSRHERHERQERQPVRIPFRSPSSRRLAPQPPQQPPRPSIARASTFEGRSSMATPLASLRVPGAPLTRVATDSGSYSRSDDIFSDDVSTPSRSGSPEWGGDRSTSPATSYGSMSRSTSALSKKPPPPPVNRAKKPPPPPPARRENLGY